MAKDRAKTRRRTRGRKVTRPAETPNVDADSCSQQRNDESANSTTITPDPWGDEPITPSPDVILKWNPKVQLPPEHDVVEEWVYEDPNAPPKLTSLNVASYCNPIHDWFTKSRTLEEYQAQMKRLSITEWVLHGTEESRVSIWGQKGVRKPWKPFSNKGWLPGAYS